MNLAEITERRVVHGFVLALLVGLAFLVVGQHVRAYPLISPVDELQHTDYFFRAWDFGIVRSGDMFGEEAMREQACRGIDDDFQVLNPDCEDPDLQPTDFQEAGYNTAYIHPPTYYTLTAIAARPLDVAGLESRVTAGRLVGGLWLAAAVVAAWLALAALRVALLARVPLLVIMICAPVTLHATATINPDSTALFAGASMLAAVLWWERRRIPWIVPMLAGVLSIGLKSTNAIGVLVVLAYVGVRVLQRMREPTVVPVSGARPDTGPSEEATDEPAPDTESPREVADYVRLAGAILAGIALVSVAWVAFSGSIAEMASSDIPMVKRFHADELTYDELRENIVAGFTPLQAAYLPPFLGASHGVRAFVSWGNAVLAAGVVIGIVYSQARSRLRALAIGALVSVVLAGPLLVIANYVFSGIYVGIPPRYALSALPALLAVCAVALERRILLVASYVGALWILVTVLDALF